MSQSNSTAFRSQAPPLFPTPATSVPRERLGYIGAVPGTSLRDSDAWYTPPQYIEAARQVMGSIDLDPFSSDAANTVIQATYYFTRDRSAFDYPWRPINKRQKFPQGVNIWMNPPYSAGLVDRAIASLKEAQESGYVHQAIVLVNNSAEGFVMLQEIEHGLRQVAS